jgi:hypothetical protein
VNAATLVQVDVEGRSKWMSLKKSQPLPPNSTSLPPTVANPAFSRGAGMSPCEPSVAHTLTGSPTSSVSISPDPLSAES